MLWVAAGILLLSGGLLFALQYRPVQTYVAKKVAAYLANQLHTTISLDGLYFKPFSSLVLQGLYISDLEGDTLLYAGKATASLDLWELRGGGVVVKQLHLTDSRVSVKHYTDSTNLSFLINYFRSTRRSGGQRRGMKLDLRTTTLTNISAGYKRVRGGPRPSGVINFNDIQIEGLHGEFKDIDVTDHLFKADVKNLRFREKSGFKVQKMNTLALVDTNSIELRELALETGRSVLGDYIRFGYDDFSSFNDFARKVYIEMTLDGTHIHSKDIAYFSPNMGKIFFDASLSGSLFGTVADFNASRVALHTKGGTSLEGNFRIRGLPDIHETVFDLQIHRLSSDSHDIASVVSQLSESPSFALPAVCDRLGNLSFEGTFHGRYHDFTTTGLLGTALGEVSSDIHLALQNGVNYEGHLSATEFDVGTLFQRDQLGSGSFDIRINGGGFTVNEVNSTVSGTVSFLDFRNYRYRNITLGGTFADQKFAGRVTVNDPNLQLDFDGDVNFHTASPEYAFSAHVGHANLYPLQLFIKTPVTVDNMAVVSNFKGNSFNNLQGEIGLHDIRFSADTVRYAVDSLRLSASGNETQRTIAIRSDIADAFLHGEIDLLNLNNYFKSVVTQYAPSMNLKSGPVGDQVFDFQVNLKKPDPVTALWAPRLTLQEGVTATGYFSAPDNTSNVNILVPKLSYGALTLDRLIIDGSAHSGALRAFVTADRIGVADSLYVNNVNLSNTLANDSLHTNLKIADVTEGNQLDFNGWVSFERNQPIQMRVLPSTLVLNHERWELDENAMFYLDEGKLRINGLKISNNRQIARLEGTVSGDREDKALLTFDNFNLATFNSATAPAGIELAGILNGHMEVTSVLKNPYVLADITATGIYVNHTEIGNLVLQADFDRVRELVTVQLETERRGTRTFTATGTFDATAQEDQLDIKAELDHTELVLFQPFLKKLVSNISGTASADVSITGSISDPRINGVFHLYNAGFTVNYLKTPYRINDAVGLSNSAIVLRDLTVTDPRNNRAVANGTVDMRNPLIPVIHVDIDATNFLVLNTTFRDNPLYYGTAYGTGRFGFHGPTNSINISIQARTEENTRFYIPLNATGTVNDNDFIRFVGHDTLAVRQPQPRLFQGLSMNMDLHITPAAETSLYTDLGELTGRGEGLLTMRVSSLGDFEMFGDYTFNSGKFTFTAQDFINKIFDINQGGNIRWTGQPTDATINLAAVYGQRTSLGPLYNAAGREAVEQRVLAHAVMNLSGNLMRPDITFALNFPNDPYVKDELQSYLSDANNVNQQALSLIVRRSFVPGSAADFSRELNNTLLSAGTELAFNQLNNLISQSLNLKFVDLNIRSLNDASASLRLFNDRLIFTGGVTDRRNLNDLNVFSDRIVTDAELLYLIRKDGRLVIRGSNRLNSRNFLPLTINENYVSALGLVYRQEFYTFNEFLKRLFTVSRKPDDEDENEGITEP